MGCCQNVSRIKRDKNLITIHLKTVIKLNVQISAEGFVREICIIFMCESGNKRRLHRPPPAENLIIRSFFAQMTAAGNASTTSSVGPRPITMANQIYLKPKATSPS